MVDVIDLYHKRAAYFLLDVRTREEFEDGHIAGAKNIPLHELPIAERKGLLPKDQRIVCICRNGDRSGKATRFLAEMGYNVTNLLGGMIDWVNEGYEVRRT